MGKYTVTHGAFRQPDGNLVVEGEQIDLDDDVAATHADRLRAVTAAPAKPPAQAPDATEQPAKAPRQ